MAVNLLREEKRLTIDKSMVYTAVMRRRRLSLVEVDPRGKREQNAGEGIG
jgi:hypothetical protein